MSLTDVGEKTFRPTALNLRPRCRKIKHVGIFLQNTNVTICSCHTNITGISTICHITYYTRAVIRMWRRTGLWWGGRRTRDHWSNQRFNVVIFQDLVAAAEQDMFNETSGHFQPGSWQQSQMFSPRRQDISCLDCGKKTEYSWQGVWTFPVWLGAEMSRGYFRLFTLHLKLIFSDEASGRFQLRCRKNISQNNHVLKPDVGTSTSGFLIWRQH